MMMTTRMRQLLERGRLLIMKGGRRSAMVHEMIGRMHIPLRQKATIIGHTLSMNGTCVQTDYSDNKNDDSSPMHFTYSVNGNTLTMTESTGEFQNVFQIKKLSQSQLVLFRSGEDAHEKFEETETYKRIK